MLLLLGFVVLSFPVISQLLVGGLREGSLPSVVLNTFWLLHIIPLPQSSPQEAAGPALGALPAPQLQKNWAASEGQGRGGEENSIRMQALMESLEPQLRGDWAQETEWQNSE